MQNSFFFNPSVIYYYVKPGEIDLVSDRFIFIFLALKKIQIGHCFGSFFTLFHSFMVGTTSILLRVRLSGSYNECNKVETILFRNYLYFMNYLRNGGVGCGGGWVESKAVAHLKTCMSLSWRGCYKRKESGGLSSLC